MVHHVLTRADLYAQVWAEPVRSVAARLGISDVGLAKACRKVDIPLPPRGWWAKPPARRLPPPPLPSRPDLPDRVVIAPATRAPGPPPAAKDIIDSSLAPTVEVRPTLHGAHRAIADWLNRHQAKLKRWRREGWRVEGLPDLTAPLQHRRLRLYSALFRALEAQGLSVTPGDDPDAPSHVTDGRGEDIAFRFYLRSRQVRRPLTAEEKRWSLNPERSDTFDLVEAGDLVLKIATYTRGAMREAYTETKRPLEAQLGEIVVAFLAGVAALKAWREEQALDAARWRRAEARKRRIAERRALEARSREQVFTAAEAWRRAQALRALVEAAAQSPVSADPRFRAWRDWALGEADATDPLASGVLDLSVLDPFDPDAEETDAG